MASERPWSKFFWSDWESDERLRQCSLAAQGLWMRMLCICAKDEPRGYLTVAGQSLDSAGVARSAGITSDEAESLMAELERWGVFSRDRKGRIYSRRMVKDEKKAKTAQKNGKRGGNPHLDASAGKQRKKPPSDNPPDKGSDKAQRPEARGQRPDTTTSPPPVTAAATEGGGEGDGNAGDVSELARVCQRIQQVVNAGHPLADLGRYVRRWHEHGLDLDRDVIPTVEAEMQRRERRGEGPPGHPKYFDKAVFRAHRERTAAPPDTDGGGGNAPVTDPNQDDETYEQQQRKQWRQRMEAWRDRGIWVPQWGMRPDERGCQCPPDILREFGHGKRRKEASG